jgi:anti-sigma factor ChrR (cupin superfamily)
VSEEVLAIHLHEGKPDSKEVSMRGKSVLALAASLALVSAVPAQTPGGRKAGRPIPIPSADLKWSDLDPKGAPGVQVADLWGDHTKGAFGAFFKLPAGFAVPLHRHTHDMKVVTVSGTYVQGPEGKPEFRLGPGSYLMQPGGHYWHTTSCDKASECLFFVESKGKFDLMLKDAGKAAAKK